MTITQNNQRKNAVDRLEELAKNKLELKRPVFFIPGWTDEACVCWMTPYLKRGTCIKGWAPQIIKNFDLIDYVSFSDKESQSCKSFLGFGDILKEKIWNKIGKKAEFDLVGHNMGGFAH